MAKYEKIFKKLLVEQPVAGTEAEQPVSDKEAWVGSFEEPEKAEEFQTEPNQAGFQSRYIERAKKWIAKLEETSEWLNGTDSNSLNKQLIDLDREGSVFSGISSQSKKLTNIAGDLADLAETIKGYILAAGKETDITTPPQA